MPPPHRRRRAARAPPQAVLALLLPLALLPVPMPELPTTPLTPTHYVIEALEHPTLARLEAPTGALIEVPRAWLPPGAREGDLLSIIVGSDAGATTLRLEVDEEATEARRRELQQRRDRLPTAPAGDLEL